MQPDLDTFSFARRRALSRTFSIGAAALLAGCSPLRLINELAPADTYRRTADLAYGSHPRQRIDVYQPADGYQRAGRERPAPMVVFFYGGSWRSGSRTDYLFVGEALASRGCVVAIADYRLFPEVRFPDFVDDSAMAVAWMHRHAAAYGGDTARMFVMGHSAGAYNAAMVALDRRYLARATAEAPPIAGLIGLAGPYDFLPLESRLLRNVFGWPDTPPETQPIRFVGPAAPPTLLLTASRDGIVSPGNSARLAARLRDAGRPVREVAYAQLDHRTLVGALAAPLRDLAPVLDDVAAFIGPPPTA
jgi:acetyl esterase/lipase